MKVLWISDEEIESLKLFNKERQTKSKRGFLPLKPASKLDEKVRALFGDDVYIVDMERVIEDFCNLNPTNIVKKDDGNLEVKYD